jgi:hypothetical protein
LLDEVLSEVGEVASAEHGVEVGLRHAEGGEVVFLLLFRHGLVGVVVWRGLEMGIECL